MPGYLTGHPYLVEVVPRDLAAEVHYSDLESDWHLEPAAPLNSQQLSPGPQTLTSGPASTALATHESARPGPLLCFPVQPNETNRLEVELNSDRKAPEDGLEPWEVVVADSQVVERQV